MARSDPRPTEDTSTNHHTWDQLQAAIKHAVDQDQNIPCVPAKGQRREADWTSDQPKEQQLAARWCQPCPAKTECLAWALATGQSYGTWGGHTSAQRKKLRREQRQRQEAAA